MYDSRSDHPHKGVHFERAWRKEDYRDILPRRLRRDAQDAITDSLAEAEVVDLTTSPYDDHLGLKRIGPAAWEAWHEDGYEMYLERDWEALEAHEHDHIEPLADWERELLGGDPEPEEDEDEEDLDTDWTPWMPTLSVKQAYDQMGDGWHVEGAMPVSRNMGGYIRVHELAFQIGVSSKSLLAFLRTTNEYVSNHLSYLALPVADRIRAEADDLIEEYGPRESTPLDRLKVLLAEEDQRAKTPRPGLWRPHAGIPLDRPFKSLR